MSQSAGACGAFGLLLSQFRFADDLVQKLRVYVEESLELEDPDGYEGLTTNDIDVSSFVPRFLALFAENGIVVPADRIGLHWSDDCYTRPGRTDTREDEWILGWGLFTTPWEYPVMDESFRAAAAWHTWAWVG